MADPGLEKAMDWREREFREELGAFPNEIWERWEQRGETSASDVRVPIRLIRPIRLIHKKAPTEVGAF
jgi:hypothetical protein